MTLKAETVPRDRGGDDAIHLIKDSGFKTIVVSASKTSSWERISLIVEKWGTNTDEYF